MIYWTNLFYYYYYCYLLYSRAFRFLVSSKLIHCYLKATLAHFSSIYSHLLLSKFRFIFARQFVFVPTIHSAAPTCETLESKRWRSKVVAWMGGTQCVVRKQSENRDGKERSILDHILTTLTNLLTLTTAVDKSECISECIVWFVH